MLQIMEVMHRPSFERKFMLNLLLQKCLQIASYDFFDVSGDSCCKVGAFCTDTDVFCCRYRKLYHDIIGQAQNTISVDIL